jgi:two-component system, OmpR family, response regulator
MRILIVEDDAATRELLERRLREERFHADGVPDGQAAEARAEAGAFDAIVLDVVLPGHDGFAVCRRLRARGVDTPILLLTGRQTLDDRVRGLDAGADDYLAKPFAFEELLARLRALTRRGRTHQLSAVLRYGPVELDQHEKVVKVNEQVVMMTATEFRLLEYFLLRAEKPVTRDELARHVWGAAGCESNVIDVYVSYLRKKLRPAGRPLVCTVRNFGYTLTLDHARS